MLTFKVAPREMLKRQPVNVCNSYEVKILYFFQKIDACRRVLTGDKVWTGANIPTTISPVEYSPPVLSFL